MRKVYFTIFFLVFALTIYGSGIAEKDAVTPHIAARYKRTEAPAFLLSAATELPSVEIVKLAESGVVASRNVTTKSRIKSLKSKIPFRKSSDGLEKRKPFLKRVKGLKRKIPFRKKTEIDKKLDLLPDLEFQADSGIVTNDRIGEVSYPREPISTRIRNLGSKLTLRRRAGSKSDVKDLLLPGETEIAPELASVGFGMSTETLANPPSSEELLNAFAALTGESETSSELPVISSESTTLQNNTSPPVFENGPVSSSDELTTTSASVKTSTPIPQSVLSEFAALLSELADRAHTETPNPSAEISHAPITSPPSKTTVDNGTKRPLLSRVKNLSKKIPLRRKTPSIQSKSDSIEVDVESRGADEYRLARLNVWWVQNYVTTDNSKPTAYYDEETIAVIGFDGTVNATTCRLLEPVLKEEKERALEDLSSAGVDLKPVTLDVMMEMISGCKEDGVPDDKWTAWTLLNGILPGTKWCGRGDVARSYEELGPEADIDRCCRAHDHCPVKIKPFKRKFGLTNISLYTKSHCECDDEFEMCLRATKNPLADILGNFYFNVLKVQCMEEAKYMAIERCIGNDCDNPKYGKMRFRDPRRFVRKNPV